MYQSDLVTFVKNIVRDIASQLLAADNGKSVGQIEAELEAGGEEGETHVKIAEALGKVMPLGIMRIITINYYNERHNYRNKKH
jgi:hypothetical protein